MEGVDVCVCENIVRTVGALVTHSACESRLCLGECEQGEHGYEEGQIFLAFFGHMEMENYRWMLIE